MTKFILNTDGGARGNPGPAGCGAVIRNEAGEVIKTAHKALGEATNNEAEYYGVILGLEQIIKIVNNKNSIDIEIELRLDSQLVARQLKKEYKIKEPRMRALADQIFQLVDENHLQLKIIEILRESNKEADLLANEAMDSITA